MDELSEWDGEHLCSYRVAARNIFHLKISSATETVHACVKKYAEDTFSIDWSPQIIYFFLTEFGALTVSYGQSSFPFDFWPKHKAGHTCKLR